MAISPTVEERILRPFAHGTQRPGDRAWVPSQACGFQSQQLCHNPLPPRSQSSVGWKTQHAQRSSVPSTWETGLQRDKSEGSGSGRWTSNPWLQEMGEEGCSKQRRQSKSLVQGYLDKGSQVHVARGEEREEERGRFGAWCQEQKRQSWWVPHRSPAIEMQLGGLKQGRDSLVKKPDDVTWHCVWNPEAEAGLDGE